MIWRELWLALLVVVWRKWKTKRWIDKTILDRRLGDAHSDCDKTWCWCRQCVSEFDQMDRWMNVEEWLRGSYAAR